MGENIRIISWNVRELNYLIKRGSVKLVLRRHSSYDAILIESKLEEVDTPSN